MQIGFHMPITNGFGRLLDEAKRLQCEVVQIFVKNPRSWEKKEWKDEEIEAFRSLRRAISVVAHLSYLPNPARADEDERTLAGLLHEAELCETLGLDRLVVHLGSRDDRVKGVKVASETINRVLDRYDITILMENAAGQGKSIGRDAAELAAVYEGIIRQERVSLCIDTAHLFESGCDIRRRPAWKAYLGEIKNRLGADKIGFFHLNDSKTGAGSHVDRHWHIGQGEIGTAFFRSLVNDKQFAHLGGVMETPKMGKMDEENMRIMRSLLSPLVSRSLS